MSFRHNFEYELEQLNIEIIKMGALIEKAISDSILALKEHNNKLALDVINKDRMIDDMEKEIEGKCLSIILRQQPVASDLRMVSAALKMVTDMERVGDHATDISELVLRIKGDYSFGLVEHIPEMAEVSQKMLHDAIASFVNSNEEDAKKTAEMDDIVDDLFDKVKNEVASIMTSQNGDIDTCIDFLMIAKYLERIGDHAENICEWVEFSKTGDYKNQRIF